MQVTTDLDGAVSTGLGRDPRPIVRLCHARFTEEPGPITDQLYWRRRQDYVKVACGVRDDGTPWVAPPEAFNELVGRLTAP